MDYILDMPWGFKHPKVKYDKALKLNIYNGERLPRELKFYGSEDFSYLRWVQDDLQAKKIKKKDYISPLQRSATLFKPRPHQSEAAKKIHQSYNHGWPSFLEADKTGIGKTLAVLAGITATAKASGFSDTKKAKVLVVCPKGVIPQWRQTLHNFPVSTKFMRVMILNYQQLGKLIEPPKPTAAAKKSKRKPSAKTLKKRAAINGTPKIDWDYVIFDEAHYLKNYPSSLMSIQAANVAKLDKAYVKGKSPYVVFATATPGSSPLNFAVMSNMLSRLIDPKLSKQIAPSAWGTFLHDKKFSVTKGSSGYSWVRIPTISKNTKASDIFRIKTEIKTSTALQRADARKIGKALTSEGAPFIMRSPKDIAGWPEQQYIPYGIELTLEQRPIYEEAWTRFRKFLALTAATRDPKGALVENLRYRQKSSLLKIDAMVEQVVDFVDSGNQVYISCQFLETVDQYKEKLTAKGLRVVEISGRTVDIREDERIKFQKGQADVVLCTVVAGISLHSGETLPDGSTASKNPRITILHDIRLDPNDTTQSAGRSHRNGINSLTYFPHLINTVDEKVIGSFINKDANGKTMTGSSDVEASDLEEIFRKAAEKDNAEEK